MEDLSQSNESSGQPTHTSSREEWRKYVDSPAFKAVAVEAAGYLATQNVKGLHDLAARSAAEDAADAVARNGQLFADLGER